MLKESVLYRTGGNEFTAYVGLRPSEKSQIYDELLSLEKELGAMLRYQRDLEGRCI